MKWIKDSRVPIMSWCAAVESGAMQQALNLARHPEVFHHVALMPDCHQGYGMPIGGVAACKDAVIPNAVGVDIGCGMCAVQTSLPAADVSVHGVRDVLDAVKRQVPLGEGNAHAAAQEWEGFQELLAEPSRPGWLDDKAWDLAQRNLGSLGGGNHFIELQSGDDGFAWLMIHSGSRNLGYRVADYYHRKAVDSNRKRGCELPCEDLSFLRPDDKLGRAYVRHMSFALDYARENRHRIMRAVKAATLAAWPRIEFTREINIHHNYAALEEHLGEKLWVHRKGATSARSNELGIIPGSMGASSYIVCGLGNEDSFASCSHGAGRQMGRMQASRELSRDACNRAMARIVFPGWQKVRRGKLKGRLDLSEAPQAYKDIDAVIDAQLDLVKPLVRLRPLGVLKG